MNISSRKRISKQFAKSYANVLVSVSIALLLIPPAHAFNGYFQSGAGTKSKSMAGVSSTLIGDAFGAGNNPAAILFSGDLIELGLEKTTSRQRAERYGSGGNPPRFSDTVTTGKEDKFTPELAITKSVSADFSFGLSYHQNGLIQANYSSNDFFTALGTTPQPDRLYFSLKQEVFSPAFAFRIGKESSIGFAPLFVSQQLEITGLQTFVSNNWTNDKSNITNNGRDTSSGVGVRVGFISRLDESVLIGATYSPKITMGKFSNYKGLFTDNARFDVPENFSIGLSIATNSATTLIFDYQRINYGGIKLLNVPSTVFSDPPKIDITFGDDNGPGFGWESINVWKLGFDWRVRDNLTLRAGVSMNDSPVTSRDVSLAVIMPSITTREQTLGATYRLDASNSLSFYMSTATGPELNGISTVAGSAIRERLKVNNRAFGIQYSHQY
jgi:long-chain fatty acid transport protein